MIYLSIGKRGAAVQIEFDSNKREKALEKHELDMADFSRIFENPALEYESKQTHHKEKRVTVVGVLGGEFVTAFYTKRGKNYRVITLRKARENEKKQYKRFIEELKKEA
jgi:hypothetical protein